MNTFLTIKGETRDLNLDRYTRLVCSDEKGREVRSVGNEQGVTTVACLEFILSTPRSGSLFAFTSNCDLEKMLRDVGSRELHLLFHPELRQRSGKNAAKGKGPIPVPWKSYLLNLRGSKFSVSDRKRVGRNGRRTVVCMYWQ